MAMKRKAEKGGQKKRCGGEGGFKEKEKEGGGLEGNGEEMG